MRAGTKARGHVGTKGRRGFSLVEMLIALAITSALLTASLAALDASFKSYQVTSEMASTNVVSRMVVQRVLAMVRTGREFGPYPADVLDAAQNPMVSSALEFVSAEDQDAGYRQITRIEVVVDAEAADGSRMLLLTIEDHFGGGIEIKQHPLLRGVGDGTFILEYDVGPRLRRATIDLTIVPNDLPNGGIGFGADAPTIRLVASASPRTLD